MAFYGMARFASRFARRAVRSIIRRKPSRPFVRRPRRVGRKTANKVHTFVRLCDKDTKYPNNAGPSIITETGSDQNLAYTFMLDNVVNPTDFTNLYDSYRINKVQLMLEPAYDQSAQVNNLNPAVKKIRVVHDYNDANILSQEDDYLEYANCKSYSPWSRRGIKITLYPKVNNTIEDQGGNNAFTFMNSNRLWLNIANDQVPHFGIKIFIPGGLSTAETGLLFRVRAKFWLSMKSSK